jgi:vesicle coat complex subunit
VRRAVVGALEQSDHHELLAVPVRTLDDPVAGIRAASLRVLAAWAAIAEPLAFEVAQLLADPDDEVRGEAVHTLQAMGRYPALDE